MLLRRVECWTECFVDPESVDNSASLYAVHPYCIGATCPQLVIATSKVQSNANCSTCGPIAIHSSNSRIDTRAVLRVTDL